MAIETTKAIICKIATEEYALDVNNVLSIERIQDIRPLPHTEAYMAGIMQLRGSIVPVMDLRIWLGLENAHSDSVVQADQRIVVTEYNGKRLGLIVDAATDVLDIEQQSIQTVEMQNSSDEVNQVANLDSRLILLLSIPKLIGKMDHVLEKLETA